MPGAAPASVASAASTAPVRRVVSILQDRIDSLEKQKNKIKNNQNDQKNGTDKLEDISALLEFAWDLIKQVMGIAVLSENEAKKQARKDFALRKVQDLQLINDVIQVISCLDRISDPNTRADFLSGCCAAQLSPEDVENIDKIYPQISPKPVTEEGQPTYESQIMDAAKHVQAIIEGDPSEVVGTTYAYLKEIISTVHQSGYFDRPREVVVEEVEEPVDPVREEQPCVEEVEPVSPAPPLVPVNPPPPAPQAVPTPTFAMLPPRAPPVTLQQVEHAYFQQQYGHQQQHPPVPEVIGPQSFIFLQDSELDSADISQQPTPRPASPASIPSQIFTNQSISIPPHFTPDLIQNPHIPIVSDIPQPVHFAPNVNDVQSGHIPNFSTANPPPPIPMPPSHPIPPHMGIPATQVVTHPHVIQQRLPSPSFQPNIPFKPQPTHGTEQAPIAGQNQNDSKAEENQPIAPIEQDASNQWNDLAERNTTEPLEIDEWNPPIENSSEPIAQTNGQGNDKYRPRGRGRGGSGGFRGRGGYQNGRQGSYYRNNDGYQGNGNNGNGRNYNDNNYRENRNEGGNRYDNSQGYQDNYRGRGTNGRGGAHRQNGGLRGAPRNAQTRGSGGPPRSQYPRKTANGNNQFESRNGTDNNKQSFSN